MISLKINERYIEIIKEGDGVLKGSKNYFSCNITFDKFWEDFEKTVVFKRIYENTSFAVRVKQMTEKIVIPHEILRESGKFKIGVFGIKDNITLPTLWSEEFTILNASDTSGEIPNPTPTVYEEILRELKINNSKNSYTKTEIDESLKAKQDTLESGKNIKTINNQSILGEGNIELDGAVYSVVELKTGLRSYDSSTWETYGAYDYEDFWNSVSNADKLKIGDIGILRGFNTDTSAEVMLFGEITKINGPRVYTKTKAFIQASTRQTKYYKFRDDKVRFKLEKGKVYSFTVSSGDAAFISTGNGLTIKSIASKSLNDMTSGVIICADRCSCIGLKGEFSLVNLNAFVSDRWDWDDGSIQQYGPYYLENHSNVGIDIWEL